MRIHWVFIALCAITLGSCSVLAADPQIKVRTKDLAIEPLLTDMLSMEDVKKIEESKVNEDTPFMEEVQKYVDEEIPVVKKDLNAAADLEKHAETLQKVNEMLAQMQAEREAEVLEQPGMRRLARYLHNFHNRQFYEAKAAILAAQRSNAVSADYKKDDQDLTAEERALRRRKRVRRRNTRNKVRRHLNNRHVANHSNSVRRRTNSRSTSKRKNTNRVKATRNQNKKRTRIIPYADYEETYPSSITRRKSNRRKSGVSSGNSKQKKKKNKNKKKKNKKNKNKKKPKRRGNFEYKQYANTGRKDENLYKEPMKETQEETQNQAQVRQQEVAGSH